jgi:peptidoglycan/LPS O-acetylase OafA/YrhL
MSLAYRPQIDGLRAIAVLAVVGYHAGVGPSAGLVGVDVFFVISGYLITSLLQRERATHGRIDLLAFYARRFRRLLPALFVVELATVGGALALLAPGVERLDVTRAATASLLFVANFFFQSHTGATFDHARHHPLSHLWSLAVEEQFYLVWPLLLGLLLRLRPRALAASIVALAVGSLVLAEVLIRSTPLLAFYQMPPRFWELAVGGLIAVRVPGQLPDGRAFAYAGVIIVLATCATPITHFPGLGVAPAVLGTALVLHAVHGSSKLGLVGAALSSRPVVLVGLVSYSLYLWHWPLLAIERSMHAGESPLGVRLALVACAMVLAWLSWRFVERPFRRADARTSNRKVVLAGVTVSVALALGTVGVAAGIRP